MLIYWRVYRFTHPLFNQLGNSSGGTCDQVTIGFGTGDITGEFAKDTVPRRSGSVTFFQGTQLCVTYGGFLKWSYPNSWMLLLMENPIKTDDLVILPFFEHLHIF